MQMGMHDAVLAGVLVVLGLIVKFPSQYRRGMARLCSVEEVFLLGPPLNQECNYIVRIKRTCRLPLTISL